MKHSQPNRTPHHERPLWTRTWGRGFRLLVLGLVVATVLGCDGGPTSAMNPEPPEPKQAGQPTFPAQPAEAPVPDHRLPSDVTRVNGSVYDIQPGDVVCLEPGTRPFLVIDGIEGRPGAPVTITNCAGGTARIRGGDTFGLVLRQSRHLRVIGSASPHDRYGLVIDGAHKAQVGFSIDERSSDVEAAFIEIKNTSFAGLMAKTNEANAGVPPSQHYVLRNLHLHDLYIHDTEGEGMYLGPTSVGPEHHTLEGVHVHDNVVARAGWDGIQVSNATEDVNVHHNVIVRSGIAQKNAHANGLQISGNTEGDYHHNLIVGSHAWGIAVFGRGDVNIANNVVTSSQGVFIDDRPGTLSDTPIRLRDNALRDISTPFFRVLNEKNRISLESNRLDGSNPTLSTAGGAGANIEIRANEQTRLGAVVFSDPSAGNFCLTTTSPYASIGLSNCRR